MSTTSIEWTEITWNPTTGCSKVSEGCRNCYAEVLSNRLRAMGHTKYKNGFKLTLHSKSLEEPYSWKSPKIVFVNSMSDLFHEDIPLSNIKTIFRIMNDTPMHTYQILTKRSKRLLEIANEFEWTENIWMGVTIESNNVINRIIDLQQTPAYFRFLSLEPLIGPIDDLDLNTINWVIVGGESGPKARPVKLEWIDNIYNLCRNYNVPFFFKQWGKSKFNSNPFDPTIQKNHPDHAKGGCEFRGRIYKEFPAVQFA